MCHNAPWLSVLDKQMRLQFAPKESKANISGGVVVPQGISVPATEGGVWVQNLCL